MFHQNPGVFRISHKEKQEKQRAGLQGVEMEVCVSVYVKSLALLACIMRLNYAQHKLVRALQMVSVLGHPNTIFKLMCSNLGWLSPCLQIKLFSEN